jgi:histone chaperone ASF1
MMLQVLYKGREFIRIGYYVNNEYDTPELRESPPNPPILDRISRNILETKPRVTRWNIEWDTPLEQEYPPEEEIDEDAVESGDDDDDEDDDGDDDEDDESKDIDDSVQLDDDEAAGDAASTDPIAVEPAEISDAFRAAEFQEV